MPFDAVGIRHDQPKSGAVRADEPPRDGEYPRHRRGVLAESHADKFRRLQLRQSVGVSDAVVPALRIDNGAHEQPILPHSDLERLAHRHCARVVPVLHRVPSSRVRAPVQLEFRLSA